MYHQFKELADLDITKEPMEVGPTMHYIMGGIRVEADSQMSTVPGLFAAGECASGINGANRLGGNSLSDLIVFGKRAGEYAAVYARREGQPRAGRGGRRPGHQDVARCRSIAARTARIPTRCSRTCRMRCRTWWASSVLEAEMQEALDKIAGVQRRGGASRRRGTPRVSLGLAHGDRPANLLAVSEAIARSAIERKESRGGHFRDDYPEKVAEFGTSTSW